MATRMLLISDTHVPLRARVLPDAVGRAIDGADVVIHAGTLGRRRDAQPADRGAWGGYIEHGGEIMDVVEKRGKSKTASLVILVAITIAVVTGLCLVGSARYALMPIYPALPSRDYQMQSAIAFVGAGVALALGAGAAVLAARISQPGRIVLIGAATVVAVGLASSFAALTIP